MLVVLIVFALADGIALWRKPVALYVSYCLGFIMVFLLVDQVVATVSQSRSSKELAEKAAPFIHPEDQVVIYNAYFSSLPFYLRINRPLGVVWSGRGGRVMGSTYVGEKLPRSAAGHGQVLLTHEQFSTLWRESRERLLVFAHAKDVGRLNEQGATSLKTILQAGDVVLVANR
jgi:hypothetical protein